jgi:hypothetical protein
MKMNYKVTIAEATTEYIEISIKGGDISLIESDVAELLSAFGRTMTRYELFDSSGSIVSDIRTAASAIVWF